jgi:hypothetical protein
MAETPPPSDPKKELIASIELKIGFVQDAYIKWWGELTDPDSRISFVKTTLQRAEIQLDPLDLHALDDYSSEMTSALATINGYLSALEKFHSTVRAHVAQILTVRGFSGFPYKDMVEGDERVASLWESYRMAERLSATITHQLKNIDSRNFRLGQEIKAGIWTGNVNSKGRTTAPPVPRREEQSGYPE